MAYAQSWRCCFNVDSLKTNTCMRPCLRSIERFSDSRARAEAKRITGCGVCKAGEVADGLDSGTLFLDVLEPFEPFKAKLWACPEVSARGEW